jgi:hypothetical protein
MGQQSIDTALQQDRVQLRRDSPLSTFRAMQRRWEIKRSFGSLRTSKDAANGRQCCL